MSAFAPRPAPRTVAVLGGGGALGAYQAGMLDALVGGGLRIDALVGCSAGALNAAFLAVDPTPARARRLAQLWRDPELHAVLSPGHWARVRGVATGRGRSLLDARPLRALVARHVPAHDLAELAVPLQVTTTSLDGGCAVLHRHGHIADVLAASCALPGLLPAVRLSDGHLHVDGGVLDGVPLSGALESCGPDDTVLVLDCALAPLTGTPGGCAALPNAERACGLPVPADGMPAYVAPVEESGQGAVDVVLRAFTVARAVANRASLGDAVRDPRVHVLPHVADTWASGLLPSLPRGPRDFAVTADLLRAGRLAGEAWLTTHPALTRT
ncbi:MAG TPA: patatin-like phospholipase family protein [Mycobacteriales bacterium]|nr:patatin-like phospholipase family protein [Mycobacteriales bacterium]